MPKIEEGSTAPDFTLTDTQGQPLPVASMGDLYLLDEDWNPIPEAVSERKDGQVAFRGGLDTRTVSISYRLDIPGFGHLVVYADNGGTGYKLKGDAPLELDLLRELAHSRLLAAEICGCAGIFGSKASPLVVASVFLCQRK